MTRMDKCMNCSEFVEKYAPTCIKCSESICFECMDTEDYKEMVNFHSCDCGDDGCDMNPDEEYQYTCYACKQACDLHTKYDNLLKKHEELSRRFSDVMEKYEKLLNASEEVSV